MHRIGSLPHTLLLLPPPPRVCTALRCYPAARLLSVAPSASPVTTPIPVVAATPACPLAMAGPHPPAPASERATQMQLEQPHQERQQQQPLQPLIQLPLPPLLPGAAQLHAVLSAAYVGGMRRVFSAADPKRTALSARTWSVSACPAAAASGRAAAAALLANVAVAAGAPQTVCVSGHSVTHPASVTLRTTCASSGMNSAVKYTLQRQRPLLTDEHTNSGICDGTAGCKTLVLTFLQRLSCVLFA